MSRAQQLQPYKEKKNKNKKDLSFVRTGGKQTSKTCKTAHKTIRKGDFLKKNPNVKIFQVIYQLLVQTTGERS